MVTKETVEVELDDDILAAIDTEGKASGQNRGELIALLLNAFLAPVAGSVLGVSGFASFSDNAPQVYRALLGRRRKAHDAITVSEAKTNLSKFLARVEQGETITIARGSEPAAMLVPVPRTFRPAGVLAHRVSDGEVAASLAFLNGEGRDDEFELADGGSLQGDWTEPRAR